MIEEKILPNNKSEIVDVVSKLIPEQVVMIISEQIKISELSELILEEFRQLFGDDRLKKEVFEYIGEDDFSIEDDSFAIINGVLVDNIFSILCKRLQGQEFTYVNDEDLFNDFFTNFSRLIVLDDVSLYFKSVEVQVRRYNWISTSFESLGQYNL